MQSINQNYKVSIKVKSFQYLNIEKTSVIIMNICKSLKIYPIKKIGFPTSRKLYTVLRSPHIDKKSREQFQQITHKNMFTIETDNLASVNLLISFLKNANFPGVEITIFQKFLSYM